MIEPEVKFMSLSFLIISQKRGLDVDAIVAQISHNCLRSHRQPIFLRVQPVAHLSLKQACHADPRRPSTVVQCHGLSKRAVSLREGSIQY